MIDARSLSKYTQSLISQTLSLAFFPASALVRFSKNPTCLSLGSILLYWYHYIV
jgi:hypothetical protein